ncbi:MAG: hypothetical protein HY819_05730 [Acidobacteria bacterium]|nr:hypothetical protein [Acidobacteriota bacterium]
MKKSLLEENAIKNTAIPVIITNSCLLGLMVLILKNQFLGYFAFLIGAAIITLMELIIALITRYIKSTNNKDIAKGILLGALSNIIMVISLSAIPGFIKMMSGPFRLF